VPNFSKTSQLFKARSSQTINQKRQSCENPEGSPGIKISYASSSRTHSSTNKRVLPNEAAKFRKMHVIFMTTRYLLAVSLVVSFRMQTQHICTTLFIGYARACRMIK